MKKIMITMLAMVLTLSMGTYAQDKKPKTVKEKPATVQPAKKDAAAQSTKKDDAATAKPGADDKLVNAKKGPDGQAVYQGKQGGMYYFNKNGNKTYLKDTDKVIAGKKGPDGQIVYEGPQGGQYYINKNGNKTYLKK